MCLNFEYVNENPSQTQISIDDFMSESLNNNYARPQNIFEKKNSHRMSSKKIQGDSIIITKMVNEIR